MQPHTSSSEFHFTHENRLKSRDTRKEGRVGTCDGAVRDRRGKRAAHENGLFRENFKIAYLLTLAQTLELNLVK